MKGFSRVALPEDIKAGRLYLLPRGPEEPLLFQAVFDACSTAGETTALIFDQRAGQVPGLENLQIRSPLVELGEIQVRIEPLSVSGSAFTSRLERGSLLVDGDRPIICAADGPYGWRMVDLSTGTVVNEDFGHRWLTFDRWAILSAREDDCESVLFEGIGSRHS